MVRRRRVPTGASSPRHGETGRRPEAPPCGIRRALWRTRRTAEELGPGWRRKPSASRRPRRKSILPGRTRRRTGRRLNRTNGSASVVSARSQRGSGQAEGARTQTGGRRRGASGAGQGGGESTRNAWLSWVPNRGPREQGTSRGDELGRGSETAEGGRSTGAGLRGSAQHCVNQPRFLPKNFARTS